MDLVYLPYSVPVSELCNCSVDGFDYKSYITEGELDNILFLSDGSLSIIKSKKKVLDSKERYQVLMIDLDNPEDLSGEVYERNVILSVIPEYEVRVGDDLEEFIPDYGQEYMVVSYADKSPKVYMWVLSMELSYRFGVKFYYHECEGSKWVFHTGKTETDAIKFIKNHKEEIENIYSVNMEFCKAPERRIKVFDF